ncbi:MAG TPA: sigma-70 family RNA polymerase sigma factor [Clostridia bacterium]|nr:sigma-70 family RNA polymerase sigma factor [Clostridia bacterium]
MEIDNEVVIEEFIREHQKDLYRFAYSYVKNPNDALDIVQDSVYKALKNSNTLKEQDKIKTWMFTIIRNTSFTFLKSKNKEISLSVIEEKSEEESISKTEVIYLKNLIKNLDQESQELITLRFYEDLQFNEIAEVLETNISTIKTRFYKVLTQIKNSYERSG